MSFQPHDPTIPFDIFDQDGALSRQFLLSRGYCCGNGCRNCPYVPRHGGPNARPPTDPPSEPRSDAAPA